MTSRRLARLATLVLAACGSDDLGDSDAAADARTDAAHDGPAQAAPPLIVAGVTISPDQIIGTSYVDGAWTAPFTIQLGANPVQGGVTVATLADGRVLAAMRGDQGFHTATWNGSWAPSTVVAGQTTPVLGRMVAVPGGALAVHWGGPNYAVWLDRYDAAQSRWTLEEDTGGRLAFHAPAVAPLGADEPLVVFWNSDANRYQWTRRVGAGWRALAPVPIALPDSFDSAAQVELIRRPGSDEVIGIFWTAASTLQTTTFSADAWSAPVTIATDSSGALQESRHFRVVALPDGRLALAYWTNSSMIKVGFHAGGGWGPFRAVPEARAQAYSPLTLSRGVGDATLEVLYSQAPDGVDTFDLKHTRLLDEAAWTWSPPQVVDADHAWATIEVAVGE